MTNEEFRTISSEIQRIIQDYKNHPLDDHQPNYTIKVVTSQYDEDDVPLSYEGNEVTFYNNSLKLTHTYGDKTFFIPSSSIITIELEES